MVFRGWWAEAAAPNPLTLLLALVFGSRWAEAAAPEIPTLTLGSATPGASAFTHGGETKPVGGRDVGGDIFGGTDGGGDIFGGTEIGGDIFGGRTAGHSTGLGDAVAGSFARATDPLGFGGPFPLGFAGPFPFGTGGAAGAAAGSGAPRSSPEAEAASLSSVVVVPSSSPSSSMDTWPRVRGSVSTYDSFSGSSREWAVPFFPFFPLPFPLSLPLPFGATGVAEGVLVDQHSDERCPAFPQL